MLDDDKASVHRVQVGVKYEAFVRLLRVKLNPIFALWMLYCTVLSDYTSTKGRQSYCTASEVIHSYPERMKRAGGQTRRPFQAQAVATIRPCRALLSPFMRTIAQYSQRIASRAVRGTSSRLDSCFRDCLLTLLFFFFFLT
jgi:hypothetical protein